MPKQSGNRLRSGFVRNRVRAILNEEIEFVWKNVKPAKEALDNAMARANAATGQMTDYPRIIAHRCGGVLAPRTRSPDWQWRRASAVAASNSTPCLRPTACRS